MEDKYLKLKDKLFILDQILRFLPGNIFWKDASGVFHGCNEQNARSIGVSSPDEIIGKTNADLFKKSDVALELDRNDQTVLCSGQELSFEEEGPAYPRNLDDIWFSKKTVIRDDFGDVIGLLGVSVNISERKALERKLEEALESARSSNMVKESFINNLSHDIRTPLMGMLGIVSEIKNEVAEGSKVRDWVYLLEDSMNSCVSFFNDILEAASIEASVSEDKEGQYFDFGNLIKESVKLFEPAAKLKGLAIYCNIDPAIKDNTYYGKRHLLQRIIVNLIGNAIKFTDVGFVRLDVVNVNEDNNIVIKIMDTGIGIEEGSLDKIFSQFVKLSDSAKGHYKGSGMGLYLVKEYLNLLKGTIKVDSVLGEGSVFTCSFKLLKKECVSEFKSVSSKENIFSGKSAIESCGDFMSSKVSLDKICSNEQSNDILLVEDNQLVAYGVGHMLKRLGYSVDIAVTGAQALEKLESRVYKIAFFDIGLPDISGIEVIEKFRKLKGGNEGIPVITLSGHVTSRLKKKCFEAGAQMVILKPITADYFAEVLEKYLGKNTVIG